MNIKIIPCIDSLLYAPVYLAIIELWRQAGTKRSQSHDHKVSIQIDIGDFEIEYCPAADGDGPVVEALVNPPTNDLVVGICDPITVIEKNFERRKSSPDSWNPQLIITGVFIDRISLSVFTRKPKPKSRAARDVVLREIISQLKSDSVNPKGIFHKLDEKRVLVCDYWNAGRTTQFLANRYLDINDDLGNQGSGTPKREKVKGEALSRDARGISPDKLIAGDADIAIVHAPWLVDAEKRRKLEFFCRECFPAIQFPFSCISTQSDLDEAKTKAMAKLLESVYVAVTLMCRKPEAALNLLVRWKKYFRHYGLVDSTKVEELGSKAIHHVLKTGCYSEALWPEPVAWEYALSLDGAWEKLPKPWRNVAWDVLNKTLPQPPIGAVRVTPDFTERIERSCSALEVEADSHGK